MFNSHRSYVALAGVGSACALVAFSAPLFAQTNPPAADCMKTETQAECHKRLKCKPDEDVEECKKRRARALKEGRDPDRDGDDRERTDRDDDDDDDNKNDRDRDDDKKDKQDKRDRDRDDDDDDKKARKRRDRDDDNDRPRRRRDRDKDDDDNARARAQRERERAQDDDDDDDDDFGSGRRRRGVLRPGTRPGFFSGGVGPSWGICYRRNCDPGDIDYGPTFYGTLDFGWHFSGDFHGPAIGANIHGGFGRFGPFDHGRFGAAFKFWWDIQLGDVGVYFTPFAQAGWSSFIFDDRVVGCDPRFFDCANNWEHFFNLQAGAMFRFILGNRGLLYVQPMTFDNVINGNGYGLLYHFEIGGGVTFGR